MMRFVSITKNITVKKYFLTKKFLRRYEPPKGFRTFFFIRTKRFAVRTYSVNRGYALTPLIQVTCYKKFLSRLRVTALIEVTRCMDAAGRATQEQLPSKNCMDAIVGREKAQRFPPNETKTYGVRHFVFSRPTRLRVKMK